MREKNNLLIILIAVLSVTLISSRSLMAYDWSIEVVDSSGSVGTYLSVAFDSDNSPCISYFDIGNADLKFAKLIDSTWSIEILDSPGNVGMYTSMVIDSSGQKNIAYFDDGENALKYAGWVEPLFRWEYQVIHSTSTSDNRIGMSLDSAGFVEVSYYDANGYDLIHAFQDSSGWQTLIIDSTGNVGQFASLAIDSENRRCWSYYDDYNGALKCAGWVEPLFRWDFETVDDVSTYGYQIDMIFNLSGGIEMSYYDLDNQDLKHVVKEGTGWIAQVVDSSGDVGTYSSLAMDLSGNRSISYYDNALHQLKFAGRLAPRYDWISEVVDDSGEVGWYPCMVFDSSGSPAISYYDLGNGDLKFAVRDSVSWNCRVVDSSDNVGKHSGLIFDVNEPKWAVSYYDETNGDLKYAESTMVVVGVPTLSEWGMLIMALLLLAAGTVAVIRRKKAVAGIKT